MNQISTTELHHLTEFALNLAHQSGVILKHFWGNVHDIQNKNVIGDLVTEADKESERCMIGLLQQEFPDHGILAEESGKRQTSNASFLWIIDPLDGTTNYAHRYPFIAVSIALLYQGIPVVGVVYNPILNELFQATSGQGALLNGKKISVSHVRTLEQSLLVSGFAYDRRETEDNNYAEFCHLTNLTQGVRRGGSAALDLAFVADGRCDGYWERGIQPWDIAAGVLIVQEAGGKVSAYDGSPLDLYSGRILATNGHLHKALSHELTSQKK